ncbi:MAG: hypothetical protein IJW11_02675 [Clostridia bacterium]|nr:hypothetical protein [Clostridia bacterium]
MSNNKKKSLAAKKGTAPSAAKPVAPSRQKRERKPIPKVALRGVLIGLIAIFVLCAGAMGIYIARLNAGFDYMDAKLSRYVKLSPEVIENVSLTVRVDKPTEKDVEQNLIALQVEHKYRPEGMADDPDAPIVNGSAVELYFIGYTLSKSGEKVYFSGGSNLGSTPDELVIGSGTFVSGFEEGLIGLRPSDTEIPKIVKSGVLSEGDTVYINVRGFHPNGETIEQYGMPIELTPALDAVYGEGFFELLVGSEIGEDLLNKTLILPGGDENEGDFLYTNIRAVFRTEGGKSHTVETYFPMDYEEETLQGVTAYFDVYVKSNTVFLLPEANDAFFTDTLGILPEKLADYEGDSLVEKYKTYVRETLAENYRQTLFTACEESFWSALSELVEVRRVPVAATKEFYDEYMLNLDATYEDYLESMDLTETAYPFKTFARDYLQIEKGKSYKKEVWRIAKQAASEKMIFFYAIEVCGVMPSESELKEAYEQILLEYAQMNSLLDESYYENISDPEQKQEAYETYLAEVEETKAELLRIRGEEYFLESAYYNFGFEKLLQLSKITYLGKGHD